MPLPYKIGVVGVGRAIAWPRFPAGARPLQDRTLDLGVAATFCGLVAVIRVRAGDPGRRARPNGAGSLRADLMNGDFRSV